MAEEDDLDFNPFYQLLQSKYHALYELAQKKCYTVCIPQTSSLTGVDMNQTFVECHLLKPSPFFQGQHLTLTTPSKTVELEDDRLQPGEGFEELRTVKILYEEKAYNKDYKQYNMLIIEEPLIVFGKSDTDAASTEGTDCLTNRIGLEENEKYLASFKEHKQVLSKFQDQIAKFKKNYMILKDYLDDAQKKLNDMYTDALETFLSVNTSLHSQNRDRKLIETLSVAVESCILGHLHPKLFPVICQRCAKEDEILFHKCRSLQGITSAQLGLKAELSCPLPAAVSELSRLGSLITPYEKLVCIKSTLDLIAQGVNEHIRLKKKQSSGDLLTSDDLIPILVTVIVQAQSQQLASNAYFMERFHWGTSTKDDLSFSMVTFTATLEYLKQTDFSHLKPVITPAVVQKQEHESKGSPSRSAEVSTEDTTYNPSEQRRKSKLDIQLDKITKMLEESTHEFETYSQSTYVPDRHGQSSRKTSQNVQLGDFLDSLKNDEWGSSYGKQN